MEQPKSRSRWKNKFVVVSYAPICAVVTFHHYGCHCWWVLPPCPNIIRREGWFRDPLALSDDELLRKYRFPRQELILLFEEMMEPQLRRRARRSQQDLCTHRSCWLWGCLQVDPFKTLLETLLVRYLYLLMFYSVLIESFHWPYYWVYSLTFICIYFHIHLKQI